MQKSLALFDFDGTITNKDTFPEFLFFARSPITIFLVLGILSPWIVLQKLGWIPEGLVKTWVLKMLFKGMSITDFNQLGEDFAKSKIPSLVRKSAQKSIETHLQEGWEVYIVTASLENWVQPWANQFGIEVIGTKVALTDQKLNGSILGKNCIKAEKVERIKEKLDLSSYKEIYVYGDSAGDKDMLQLATKPFYRYFKD